MDKKEKKTMVIGLSAIGLSVILGLYLRKKQKAAETQGIQGYKATGKEWSQGKYRSGSPVGPLEAAWNWFGKVFDTWKR